MDDGQKTDGDNVALPPGSPSVTPTDEGVVVTPFPDQAAEETAEEKSGKPKKTRIRSIKDVLALVSRRLEQFVDKNPEITAFEAEEIFCKLVRVYVEVTRCKTDGEVLGITPFQLKGHRRLA